MTRYIQIFFALMILVGLGVALYLIFFGNRSSETSTETPTEFPGDLGPRLPTDNGSDLELGTSDVKEGAGTRISPELTKITAGPVSYGLVALAKPAYVQTSTSTDGKVSTSSVAKDVEIRYIERLSGNTYSFDVHRKILRRLTNQTIPGIVSVSWTNNGTHALTRFINEENSVDTYVLKVASGSGFFLEQNLTDAFLSSKNIYTQTSNTNGTVGTFTDILGEKSKTIFQSTLGALRVENFAQNLLGTTKASKDIEGYAFSINTASGAFSRLLGPVRALSTLPSPDGKKILFSGYTGNTLELRVYDVATKESVTLPLTTLAEKCAWFASSTTIYCGATSNPPANIPDSWYLGDVSFTDRLWRVDLTDRVAVFVANISEEVESAVDIIELSVDPEEDTVSFINKRDGALYVYDL